MGVNNHGSTSPLTIRRAGADDFPIVMQLLEESIAWLRGKGLDQWSTWPQWRTKMSPSLERGDVWLLCEEGDLIGTLTVELTGDPDFWTEAERAERAAYVSKLAVRRDHAGREIGAALLSWARDYAYRHGCSWLRLDAWKTNEDLHSYYSGRGWTYLRTVSNPRRHSGALFQISARPGGPGSIIEEAILIETFPTSLRSSGGGTLTNNSAGNYAPSHVHEASQFTVDYQWVGKRYAYFVPGIRYRIREIDGNWTFEEYLPGQGPVVSPIVAGGTELTTGSTYVFTHNDNSDPCHIAVMVEGAHQES